MGTTLGNKTPQARPWWVLPAARGAGRWIAPLYLVMALVMLPWIGVLWVSLPDRVVSHNYRLAWVGFDILLVAAMARTAWLSWRRSPFVVNVASSTATLLLVDAWFDVTTAPPHEVMRSFALALLIELPAAVLSLVIAGRAQEEIARTGVVHRPHRVGRRLFRWRRSRPDPAVEGMPATSDLRDTERI